MTATAYIALGSNLGERRALLEQALAALRAHPDIRVTRVSTFRDTEPVGGPPGQGRYLNAAAAVVTELSAPDLLQVLLAIEQRLGRVREERFGPRTVDLDLLLYDDLICDTPTLTVPHPRLHERLFVLEPLAEIAPEALHPVLHRTARGLLEAHSGTPHPQEPLPPHPLPEAERGSQNLLLPSPRGGGGGGGARELAGLRAVVTGSTSGIGRAIALELARAGADVVIHGRRSQAAAEAVAAQVRASGTRSHVLLADLREAAECRRLVEAAWSHWSRIDVWINNAGADTLTGEAAHWSFERKWQELLAVDVTATMLLSREVGRRMRGAGGGVLLNMGWDQADTGMEGDSGQLFGASKGAVMAFSKSLALSLAPEVRVNCLAPGWIRTAWGERASDSWQQRVCRETPLGRWGTPEDVAAAARWLVGPAAAYVTGQVIRVNGGAVR